MLFLSSALCLLLMIYQKEHGPVKVFSAVEVPIIYLKDELKGLSDSIRLTLQDKEHLKKEVAELKKRVLTLQVRLQDLEYLEEENRRLKKLLQFQQDTAREIIFARVISALPDRYSGVIIIDKGSRDGVRRNMAVRTIKGLVGKVVEVRENYSRVLLLTDPNFSVAVRMKGTEINGILSGTGNRHCILKYISKDERIKEGSLLVTSGMDRIFPEGIPVGYVSEVREGGDLFYEIKSTPLVKIDSLKEVVIIKR